MLFGTSMFWEEGSMVKGMIGEPNIVQDFCYFYCDSQNVIRLADHKI